MAQGFMTFDSVMQSVHYLSDEEAGMAYKAACNYYLTGEEPTEGFSSGAGMLWGQLRFSVDNAKRRHAEAVENGKKGASVRYGKTESSKPKVEQNEHPSLTEDELQRQRQQDFESKRINAIDRITPYL